MILRHWKCQLVRFDGLDWFPFFCFLYRVYIIISRIGNHLTWIIFFKWPHQNEEREKWNASLDTAHDSTRSAISQQCCVLKQSSWNTSLHVCNVHRAPIPIRINWFDVAAAVAHTTPTNQFLLIRVDSTSWRQYIVPHAHRIACNADKFLRSFPFDQSRPSVVSLFRALFLFSSFTTTQLCVSLRRIAKRPLL